MASFPIIVLKSVLSFSVLRKIQNCSCQFKPIIFWKAVLNFIRVGDYKTRLGVCRRLLQWDLVYRGSQKPVMCNHMQRVLSLSAEFVKLRHEYKKDRKLIGTVYGKWFAWINESNSRLISSLEFIFQTKQRCFFFFFFIFLSISCDVSHCLQVCFFFF